MNHGITALVQRHLAAWNATAAGGRSAAIAAVYTADVVVGEPAALLSGHDGMEHAIAQLQAAVPNAALALDGEVQTTQDMTTYRWLLGPAGGPPAARGRDVITVRDGVIASVHVFMDG